MVFLIIKKLHFINFSSPKYLILLTKYDLHSKVRLSVVIVFITTNWLLCQLARWT